MDWETLAAAIPSLGLLFFLWKEGLITFNLKKKNGNGNGKDVPAWAERLIEYVNHDQTGKIEDVIRKLEEHDKIERDSLEILRGIDKYGVKIRQ